MKKITKIAIAVLSSVAAVAAIGATVGAVIAVQANNFLNDLQNIMIDEYKAMCNIPHSSDKVLADAPYAQGKVWQMSCYLREKFENLTGKYVNQDKYGNLWFDVDANCKEMEDAPILAMQGHMDMVFSFDASKYPEGYEPDPKTTKIQIVDEVINGKRTLHSKDYATSIGADDGLGVAQIYAILSTNKIKHGKLRIIITNCEENALQGAKLLVQDTNPTILKDVKYMLNIDGEDLGDICVASSGGVGSYYSQTFDVTALESGYSRFTLNVTGLAGGHSGADIEKHRINALKLINDVLFKLIDTAGTYKKNIQIANYSTPGCTAYNKIPSTATVTFATDATETEIKAAVDEIITAYKNEDAPSGDKRGGKKYSTEETAIIEEKESGGWYKNWSLSTDTSTTAYISKADSSNIIGLQNALEYGPKVWPTDEEMEKMTGTQTSACIAPVITSVSADGKTISYKLATYSRSNDNTTVTDYLYTNTKLCHDYLGETVKGTTTDTYYSDASFPGWPIDSNDSLRELCKKGWLNAGVDSSKVKCSRTHGGLECSWWISAMEHQGITDGACVSYGPQITGAHEPNGTVELDTVEACLKTTIYMLEHAKELK